MGIRSEWPLLGTVQEFHMKGHDSSAHITKIKRAWRPRPPLLWSGGGWRSSISPFQIRRQSRGSDGWRWWQTGAPSLSWPRSPSSAQLRLPSWRGGDDLVVVAPAAAAKLWWRGDSRASRAVLADGMWDVSILLLFFFQNSLSWAPSVGSQQRVICREIVCRERITTNTLPREFWHLSWV
jgi:hypothetical protein